MNIRLSYVAFWLLLGGVTYLGFDVLTSPKVSRARVVGGTGSITIPRSYDQHFYVEGSINGYPVTFMIDTGATTITVGDALASKIGLAAGVAATFSTAGGRIVGRVVPNNDVEVGGIRATGVRVAVNPGLNTALLGQDFLSKVEMTQGADHLILRMKGPV